jgi:large-conductance mechanosensitive channel
MRGCNFMEQVSLDFTSILFTMLNLALIAVIVLVIVIVIKNSTSRNKESNKKLNTILEIISNLLEDKRR